MALNIILFLSHAHFIYYSLHFKFPIWWALKFPFWIATVRNIKYILFGQKQLKFNLHSFYIVMMIYKFRNILGPIQLHVFFLLRLNHNILEYQHFWLYYIETLFLPLKKQVHENWKQTNEWTFCFWLLFMRHIIIITL